MKYLKLFEDVGDKTFMNWLMTSDSDPNYINTPDISKWEDLKTLTCSRNYLIDLEGIEKLPNLEKLWCNSNKIISLKGIENLKKLISINADYNKLTNINGMQELNKLTSIGLSNNKLQNMEFSDFSIEAFELGIDETDLSRFKKLKYLNCGKNQFSKRYKRYITRYCEEKNISGY